ncbi:hypothetical protein QR680_018551 [Steinernema hermaphroditum]|uniref:Uncharacterized protein n=1 Tax=Steinernema hermaphroditum TaxID=289476 RepID=A0AA39LQX7_9BILA|nr:hypothetical protein QR680_018551 [Steinernema hermaphroditum]
MEQTRQLRCRRCKRLKSESKRAAENQLVERSTMLAFQSLPAFFLIALAVHGLCAEPPKKGSNSDERLMRNFSIVFTDNGSRNIDSFEVKGPLRVFYHVEVAIDRIRQSQNDWCFFGNELLEHDVEIVQYWTKDERAKFRKMMIDSDCTERVKRGFHSREIQEKSEATERSDLLGLSLPVILAIAFGTLSLILLIIVIMLCAVICTQKRKIHGISPPAYYDREGNTRDCSDKDSEERRTMSFTTEHSLNSLDTTVSHSTLCKEVDDNEAEVRRLNEALSVAHSECAKLKETVDVMTSENLQLRAALEEFTDDADESINRLHTEVSRLEEEIQEKNRALATKEKYLEEKLMKIEEYRAIIRKNIEHNQKIANENERLRESNAQRQIVITAVRATAQDQLTRRDAKKQENAVTRRLYESLERIKAETSTVRSRDSTFKQ